MDGVFVAIASIAVCFLLWNVSFINDWWYLKRFGNKIDGPQIPPGSMGLPLIGEFLDFLWCFKFTRNPENFILKRKARYGDTGIYRTHLFGYPSIITCSPELIKYVLGSGTESGIFGAGWPSARLLGSLTISMVDGASHKRLRKHLLEAINSPRSLKNLLAITQPKHIIAFEDWVSKGKIVADDEIRSVSFATICDLLASFKSRKLLKKMQGVYVGLLAGIRSMTLNIPGTAFHHALKCREKLTNILSDELKERREQGTEKQDFMQILMDSVDENGEKLSGMEVVENIVSLILGGYESTANVMTWSLYYLAKYPAVFHKLKEEALSIRKGKSENELLTMEDVKAMKYTSKVATEVIRLGNVSPFVFRTVEGDNVVIDGYKVPKGWKVIVWLRSIHVDPTYYEDPHAFNPDRWDEMKPKVGTYNVFGLGPRLCPGNNFAILQLTMFLHYASLKYRWELLNPNVGTKYLSIPKPIDGAEMYFNRA